MSPDDSVFSSHQDSGSSEDYKTAHQRTPSPSQGTVSSEATTTPLLRESSDDTSSALPILGEGEGEGEGDGKVCSSPPSSVKISDFHKSLSDLAHSFSSVLISEDEKNVLKSAE